MRKPYLALLMLICFSGCAHTADIDIKGTHIQSPYGSGDGEIIYHSTWGTTKCQK